MTIVSPIFSRGNRQFDYGYIIPKEGFLDTDDILRKSKSVLSEIMETNTSSLTDLTVVLNVVHKNLTLSLSILLFIGLVGNSMNFIVFRQLKLQKNPIALLFSASAIFNIIVLIYGIGTSLYTVNHVNPEIYSLPYCKLRLYLRHVLLMIVRAYIVLACASSFALSSTQNSIRLLCQIRNIKVLILIVPLVSPLIAFHMPIWTSIENDRCVTNESYIIPFAVYFFLIVGVLPIFLMILFIILTIKNLTSLHNRVQTAFVSLKRIRSRDRQFIKMLSSLVLMYITTNMFFPINTFYMSVTYWTPKSAQRIAIESIIYSITSNHILYINNISPFFLFSLSSSAFRKSVRMIIGHFPHKLKLRKNRVQPIFITNLSVL